MNNKVSALDSLLTDVSQLINDARHRVAVTVNAELTLLYWRVGKRINGAVLQGKRAEYGKEIIKEIAHSLTIQYGKGWGEKQLRNYIHFTEVYPDEQIVYSLSRQLTWTHIRLLIFMDDPLKREFYIEICKLEHWSVRQLHERIDSMLYERTAISKKPEETIKQDLQKLRQEKQLSPDLVFRDPYLLNFLGLADTYAEKDLESPLARELAKRSRVKISAPVCNRNSMQQSRLDFQLCYR